MKNTLRTLLLLAGTLPGLASATLIGFDPSEETIGLGDQVAIDIVATPEGGELIGAYDFIVNFDPSILALNDLVFGPSLNDDPFLCDLFACRGFFDSGGAVAMFELASPFVPLGSLQDGIARGGAVVQSQEVHR